MAGSYKTLGNGRRPTVAILGESILDIYVSGTASRLSRESPVPVVDVEHTKEIPGGAANTAVNVSTLGANAHFFSVSGEDQAGKRLKSILEKYGVNTGGLIQSPIRETITKQRVSANNRITVRFDSGTILPLYAFQERKLLRQLKHIFPVLDALIISDYAYGVVTDRLIDELVHFKKTYSVFTAIDAKDPARFSVLNPDVVKPNYEELVSLLKLPQKTGASDRMHQTVAVKKKLFGMVNAKAVAVTLDKDGAIIVRPHKKTLTFFTQPAPEENTSGAGDTFIAAYTLAKITGQKTVEAADFAMRACEIVTRRPGTAPCYLEEIKNSESQTLKHVANRSALNYLVEKYREQGQKVVFTNGCFDILHSGHVRYLMQAKSLGDVLIVGVNSDRSISRLKGTGRPINDLYERIQILSGLSSIDHLIEFEENTPANLIKIVKPDIFVKGGDYRIEDLPEAPLVKDLGGKVVILPYNKGHSTTSVIQKIQDQVIQKQNSKNGDKRQNFYTEN